MTTVLGEQIRFVWPAVVVARSDSGVCGVHNYQLLYYRFLKLNVVGFVVNAMTLYLSFDRTNTPSSNKTTLDCVPRRIPPVVILLFPLLLQISTINLFISHCFTLKKKTLLEYYFKLRVRNCCYYRCYCTYRTNRIFSRNRFETIGRRDPGDYYLFAISFYGTKINSR